MAEKQEKNIDTVNSLDFLLKDIFGQIKVIDEGQKDTPYTKLIELFFKGVDLREKLLNSKKSDIADPPISYIKGLDDQYL